MVVFVNSFYNVFRASAAGIPVCVFTESNGSVCASIFLALELLQSFEFFSTDGAYVTITSDCIESASVDVSSGASVFRVYVNNDVTIADFASSDQSGLSDLIRVLPHESGDDIDSCIIKILKNSELLPCAAVKRMHFSSILELRDWGFNSGILCFDLKSVHELHSTTITEVCHSALFLAVAPLSNESIKARISIYRDTTLCKCHYAITIGEVDFTQPVLTRVHSSCYTGDLLMSLSCDCFYQLRKAIEFMSENGGGVLVYLLQEGRGIGLVNKIRSYNLQQNKCCDTLDANKMLGFDSDERDFAIAASILKKMGIFNVKLITNNPAKSQSIYDHGIKIDGSIPFPFLKNKHNSRYIKTKIERFGHKDAFI